MLKRTGTNGSFQAARWHEIELTHDPDMGIIDISLPGMDGYEVAKRIREEPHGRGMLLLALTGYSAPGDAKLASSYGFDHHLVKPIDLDQLTYLLSETAEGSSQAELWP